MTPEGKRMAISAFRLLTLLLPPSQRKHLQLLLRFMSKAARNEKLMLDVAVSTRALVQTNKILMREFYQFMMQLKGSHKATKWFSCNL